MKRKRLEALILTRLELCKRENGEVKQQMEKDNRVEVRNPLSSQMQHIGWLVGLLVGWLVGQFASRSVEWLID